jgi:hypothetical protein
VNTASTSREFKLVEASYQIEQFSGDHCRCWFVEFETITGDVRSLVTVLMLSVDGTNWTGQFTGSPEEWKIAQSILTSIETDD